MRGEEFAGNGWCRRPRKSLIWVEAMSRAMPLVKPMVTGRGMNLTAEPRPVTPMMSSRTPAMTPTRARPPMPNLATIPATMTTKAPVGPPIWSARAAQRGDEEAGDDGGVQAGLRGDAGGDGEGHGQGQRDQADGDAGDARRGKVVRGCSRGGSRWSGAATGLARVHRHGSAVSPSGRACPGTLSGGAWK